MQKECVFISDDMLTGRKFAHDKTFGDCAMVMFPTMLRTLKATESRKEAFADVQKVFLLERERACERERVSERESVCVRVCESLNEPLVVWRWCSFLIERARV